MLQERILLALSGRSQGGGSPFSPAQDGPPQQRTIRPSMYTLSRPGNPAVEWDRNMHPKGTSWLQVFKGACKKSSARFGV